MTGDMETIEKQLERIIEILEDIQKWRAWLPEEDDDGAVRVTIWGADE